MLLVIDVGNTNIVMGAMDGYTVSCRTWIETDRAADTEAYTRRIREALCSAGLTSFAFEGAVLSSVVPSINDALCQAVKNLTGCTCLVVTTAMRTDMPILMEEPDTLAADILTGCVEAKAEYPLPLAVVDMGTATTVMVVDSQGCFRGGAIIPGVKLSLSAMVKGTSLLPDMELYAPEKCIGAGTESAMCSGLVYGAAAMVDGLVDRMEAELGEPMQVVFTGGLSGLVGPHCRRKVFFEPDLLLKGMVRLYEKNVKQ